MRHIYGMSDMASPFIVTHVGENQHQVVLASKCISEERDSFVSKLYSVFDNVSLGDEYPSFIRLFDYNGNIIVSHYWATTIPEVGSGRKGLFVILGLSFPSFYFLKYTEVAIEYMNSFFISVQNEFWLSGDGLNCIFSDDLYRKLQDDTEQKMEKLYNRYLGISSSVPRIDMNKAYCRFRRKFRGAAKKILPESKKSERNTVVVNGINGHPFLSHKMSIMMNEFKKNHDGHGNQSISTNPSFSNFSYRFLDNGNVFMDNNIVDAQIYYVSNIKYTVFQHLDIQ